MTETARDGPRPLSLPRILFPTLRFAQSVAKQLVCFVRRPSDRLRADNRQNDPTGAVLRTEILAARFLPRIFSISHSFFFLDPEPGA